MISRLLLAVALLITPAAAQAAVNNISPSPSKVTVSPKGTTTVNLTWNVTVTAASTGVINLSSAEAALMINGVRITGLAGTLSQDKTLTIGQVTQYSFTESFTIPLAYAKQIIRADAGSVVIRRVFTDGATTVPHQIPVSTGNTGILSVKRIELKFDNNSRTDVVKKGESLRAVADINFRSNGLLRGEWRLVQPSSSLGETRGRVLQVVRQQLVSSGEGRTRIISPPLPTDLNGLHLLSFSVEDTDSNITVPILRYFVVNGSENGDVKVMDALTPKDGASIAADTVFSWEGVKGADAYQVEIFEKGANKTIAAQLVPASDLKLVPSALVLEDLISGTLYEWRVRAFDGQGHVIAASEKRSIKTP